MFRLLGFSCALQRPIYLFTHYPVTVLAEIIVPFSRFQAGYIRIDGSVPSSERIQLVHKFQNDPETRVAVLSIQAAGQVVNQNKDNNDRSSVTQCSEIWSAKKYTVAQTSHLVFIVHVRIFHNIHCCFVPIYFEEFIVMILMQSELFSEMSGLH